jgi:hypothetical protein
MADGAVQLCRMMILVANVQELRQGLIRLSGHL